MAQWSAMSTGHLGIPFFIRVVGLETNDGSVLE
jgi:hypothetical protein